MTQSSKTSGGRDLSPAPASSETNNNSNGSSNGIGGMARGPPNREVARPVANLGNTCYMNAVLQALAHAPELCLAMDAEPHHSTCPIFAENAKYSTSPSSSPLGMVADEEEEDVKPTRKSRRSHSASAKRSPTNASSPTSTTHERKFCTLCEVERHLRRVHSPAPFKDKPVSPSTFVHGFIDHVAPWFKLGVQEDSHEFLRLLIDAMQRSCNEARSTIEGDAAQNGSENSTPQKSTPERRVTRNSIKQEQQNSPSSSSQQGDTKPPVDNEYPFQLFRGKIESQVTCEHCKATSSTLDPIEDIGLEVSYTNPDAMYKLTDVSAALQRFAKAEALDAAYKCEKCGKLGKATKQSRLASIPPILTLHLKRFRYGDNKGSARLGDRTSRRSGRSSEIDMLTGRSGSAKIEGHARFDPVFDLNPYLTPELQKKHSNNLCRLFAVIVHAGKNSHSGHYIAYVRNVVKNEWWKMDDARVTVASLAEVTNAEAYMLFYRVVEHPFAQHVRHKAKELEDAWTAQQKTAAKAEAIDNNDENNSSTNNSKAIQQSADDGSGGPGAENASLAPVKQEPALDRDGSGRKPVPPTRREIEQSRRSHNSRKRKAPEYTCGEDWARAKTDLPRTVLHRFRDIEHIISDIVGFKPEFLKMITEQASRRSAQVGHGPSSGISPCDDFTEEPIADVKRILKNLFCALEGQQRKEGRSLFQSHMRATMPPPTTRPAPPADKEPAPVNSRIANIVVDDDADLL